MHMRGGPPSQGGPNKAGGLGYSKLMGNLLKLYNPMGQGPYG